MIWRFLFHPYGLLNIGLQSSGCRHRLARRQPPSCQASSWRASGASRRTSWSCTWRASRASRRSTKRPRRSTGLAGQRFRYIALPLLRPTILLVVVVSIMLMSKVFTSVLIISNGGPDGASRVLSLFIYQTGFQYFKMGLACAASVCPPARHHGAHARPVARAPRGPTWLRRWPLARLRAGLGFSAWSAADRDADAYPVDALDLAEAAGPGVRAAIQWIPGRRDGRTTPRPGAVSISPATSSNSLIVSRP